ncbi:MAG: choice-of-anchor Q domain-containing protein, partial [Bacteroidota bacterium]
IMKKLTLLVALLCSISAFSATTYLVELGNGLAGSASWTRAAGANEVKINLTTITGGPKTFNSWINAAGLAANDQVWMAAGTYTINSATYPPANVSIFGGFAGTETATSQRTPGTSGNPWDFTNSSIIDGTGATQTAGIKSNPSSTSTTYFDGLVIQNFATVNSAASSLNAQPVELYTNTVMQNCIIKNNTSTSTNASGLIYGCAVLISGGQLKYSSLNNNSVIKGTGGSTGNLMGGAVIYFGNATSAIIGCTFESNSAPNGGGAVYMATNGTNYGGGTIQDCIFKTNTTSGFGGAIGSNCATATSVPLYITNCQFIENTSLAHGGAMNILMNISSINISGCSFIGNSSGDSAGNGGGAIFVSGSTSQAAFTQPIKNCIFRDNKITNTGGEGAAIHIKKALTLQNCIFSNNTATANKYAVTFNVAGCNMYNCTVANNSTSGTGAAVGTLVSTTTLTNNVFYGNAIANIGGAGAVTATYNATDGTAITGTGNINTLTSSNTFVNPTVLVGAASTVGDKALSAAADWRLKWNAPAVNVGSDLSASFTTDFTGTVSRPQGGSFDMGAYELPYYNTTVTFNAGGTVNNLTNGAVSSNPKGQDNMAYIITPNHGMGIQSILYNGTDVKTQLTNLLGSSVNYGGTYTAPALSGTSTLAITFEIDPTTSISELSNKFICYVSNQHIELKNINKGDNITIYNITGSLISQQNAIANEISISLSKGIYLVKVTDQINKVIVQ